MVAGSRQVWVGVYAHEHGVDVEVYPDKQSCLLGLCEALLSQFGTKLSPLGAAEELKFLEKYKTGEYEAALLRFSSQAEFETVEWTERMYDPQRVLRPYTEAEILEVAGRVRRRAGEKLEKAD